MTSDDRRIQDAILAATNDAAILDVAGCGAIGVQLVDALQVAAWSGTVQFEASLDGRTWVGLNMVPSNSSTAVTSATAAGCWSGNCGGYRSFRVRLSVATAGAVRVNLQTATSGGK